MKINKIPLIKLPLLILSVLIVCSLISRIFVHSLVDGRLILETTNHYKISNAGLNFIRIR